MDGSNANRKFSNKFEKAKETNFKTDLMNMGSCSFHKLRNTFLGKNSAVWIAHFLKFYSIVSQNKGLPSCILAVRLM